MSDIITVFALGNAGYDKEFLIIGPWNAVTYKDVFPLIKENRIWLGYGFAAGNAYFAVSSGREYAAGVYDEKTGHVKFRNVTWFTNLDHSKRHDRLVLCENYTSEKYPKYDNYDAIEVSKTKNIPKDWDGVMGVPITFLDKYNPEQFEIIDLNPHFFMIRKEGIPKPKQLKISGRKDPYARILIRNKQL